MRLARDEPALAQRGAAEQQRGRLARAQRLARRPRRRSLGDGRAPAARGCGAATDAALEPRRRRPGRISVATWPGGPVRGGDGVGRVGADVVGASPSVRIQPDTLRATVSMSDSSGASYCLWYVAWSPTMLTIGDLALRALCRLASPLPRPGPEVQQRRGRPVGHARVAVGRAGGDALEQREHAAHLGHVVERGDEVHLRRAGVREADVDAARDERADQRLGAVHRVPLAVQSKIVPGFRMPLRVERRLDAAHQRRSSPGSSSSRKYFFFSVPMPCSPEIAPPSAMPGLEDAAHQDRGARSASGLEHRQVDVAVAGVAAAGDPACRARCAIVAHALP